jgi:hypothetical protein
VGGGACGPSGPSGASVADGSQRQRRGASWRPRPTAHGWANGLVCQDMRAVVDLAKHGLSCRTRHNRARTQVRVGVTTASHQLSIVGGVYRHCTTPGRLAWTANVDAWRATAADWCAGGLTGAGCCVQPHGQQTMTLVWANHYSAHEYITCNKWIPRVIGLLAEFAVSAARR